MRIEGWVCRVKKEALFCMFHIEKYTASKIRYWSYISYCRPIGTLVNQPPLIWGLSTCPSAHDTMSGLLLLSLPQFWWFLPQF